MFAGAAREAVFSNPEVIRRVNAHFVPVALKAALVNRPPDDEEGQLYREIARSRRAPQGICVVNSAGKVLDWVLTFDDDPSMVAFFDHALQRFTRYPDAKKPARAEVYQRFPSLKRQEVADGGRTLPVLDGHPAGKPCPAEPLLRKGTVAVRLFGRALDPDGKPIADTLRQESYAEDRFNIEVETQDALVQALARAGQGSVHLPAALTRQWVQKAYLGVLDVQPLDNPVGSPGELRRCDFRATRVESGNGPAQWRVHGESEVYIDTMANAGPGDLHEVRLTWDGFLELDRNRLVRLVLSASGRERLKFNSTRGKAENEVAVLPAGHRVDLDGPVRFGLLGQPAGPDRVVETAPAAGPAGPQPAVPEEARRQILEMLGPRFVVFRDRVQADLRLSVQQRAKLEERLPGTVREAVQFFQRLGDPDGSRREMALQTYREKAQGDLQSFLKATLTEAQLKRLRQVELQQEGAFALLGRADLVEELKITDEQRRRMITVAQELQAKIGPLVQQAQSGARPQEIRPKMLELRREHERRLEALLTEAQRKQWQVMLGKLLDLGR